MVEFQKRLNDATGEDFEQLNSVATELAEVTSDYLVKNHKINVEGAIFIFTVTNLMLVDSILNKLKIKDMTSIEAMEFLKDKMKFTYSNEEFLASMNG